MDFPWFVVSLIRCVRRLRTRSRRWIDLPRERPLAAVIWIVLLMTLGNAIACFYVLVCLARSGGSWPAFWLGARQARHA
jgi:hypothetical protein